MKYALVFFLCGHSGSGTLYCEWKTGMIFASQERCQNALYGTYALGDPRPDAKLGIGYLLARCVPRSE